MEKISIKEFKPTIFFLLRFLGFYLIGNLIYGLYVTQYKPRPDPITRWVTSQTAAALAVIDYPCNVKDHDKKATTLISFKNVPVIAVFEGCNGVNIVIIFAGFLFAFDPYVKSLWWFVPGGILLIHIFNIFRIGALFFITLLQPGWLYFTHKYLFTAFIYLIVFLLWLWWVKNYSNKRKT